MSAMTYQLGVAILFHPAYPVCPVFAFPMSL